MINKKTLLVLGAGASMPYGLPSGEELWRRLCAIAESPQPRDVIQLFEGCDYTLDDLRTFARIFRRSAVRSIDIFLAHRPEFDSIGKLAIAYEIARCEVPASIFQTKHDDDWYTYLWHRMRAGADSAQAISNNKLRIITFNYDRSLEYFLFQAIRNTYNVTEEVSKKTLGALLLEHVYGSVGKFDPSGLGGGREYGSIERPDRLRMAAAEVRTIPETRADNELFQKFRTWFDWADEVAFMGFSFDEQNIERLGFGDVIDWKREHNLALPRVIACTLGLTDVEVVTARRQISIRFEWQAIAKPNLQFLRNTDLLS